MPVAFHLGRPLPLTVPSSDSGGATVPHPLGEWGQSFVFTDALVQDMRESAELTREDGKERGFYLCKDPNTKVTGKNALTRSWQDQEPIPLPKLDLPWAVLNAAGRCTGDNCAVNINQRCEPVSDWLASRKLLKEYGVYPGIVAGTQSFGHHHTHPNRQLSQPSIGDKLNIIWAALYDGQQAMGCITGVRLKETDRRDWPRNGDAFGCYAIPASTLPTADQYDAWMRTYRAFVQPYYDEWRRLGTEESPTKANYSGYDEFREAYDRIDRETAEVTARIEFPNIDKMAEGTANLGGVLGGDHDKTTNVPWQIIKWTPGWARDMAWKAGVDHLVDTRYFDTYKVRTRTTTAAEVKKAKEEVLLAQEKWNAERAWREEEAAVRRERDRQGDERREREERERQEQERLERDKQVLERIRAEREKRDKAEGDGGYALRESTFAEVFGDIENCINCAGGITEEHLQRIAIANGLHMNLHAEPRFRESAKRSACQRLSKLGGITYST